MSSKKFFTIFMIIFMLFSVSGCGGSGGHTQNITNNPVSPDKPAPIHEPKSDDITIIPEPSPLSQDKSVSQEPIPTPIISHDPVPTPILYTVTFNSNGGSAVASIHTSSGGTVIMPENPVREGYVFAGWYKDEAFTEVFTFGADGDKITKDTTLHAQWLDKDLLRAEYSASEIVIGYADGDNPKYVTRKLTLPIKSDSVDISWSSSSGAVATDGTVTRQAEDTDVTLTATASYNGKLAEPKTFELRVIRRRNHDNSAIKAFTIEEASSGDIEVTRKSSGDVTDIEGQYVSFDIHNADDALDAVTVLREELGIRSPDKELETFLVTSDAYGAEYQFQQVYNGVKVFGRSIMVSTNASGMGDFLHSSFLNSDILDSANMKINLTPSQAEARAKSAYSRDVEVDISRTERVVYSLESFDNLPVYAYIVTIYSTSEDDYIDDTVFINADTGEAINNFSNIYNFKKRVYGFNELEEEIPFYVSLGDDGNFYLYDADLKVGIALAEKFYKALNANSNDGWSWRMRLSDVIYADTKNNNLTHYDGHSISAYTNMAEIQQWWKDEFHRDSIDGKGKDILVLTHNTRWKSGWEGADQAYWKSTGYFSVGENSLLVLIHAGLGFVKTFAAAIDVLTHEYTHAVIQYDVPGNLPSENTTGAINEGYADIFGCIKDNNWVLAEKCYDGTFNTCLRNIAQPKDNKAAQKGIERMSEIKNDLQSLSDSGGVHTNCFIISHAAYLMHKDNDPVNGLTWDELGQVWYKSIHMGLSSKSNFKDVRRCVIWAAKELRLNDNKLDAIRAAFDSVGISETKGTLKGTVSDYDTGEFLSDVDVTLLGTTVSNDSAIPYFIGRDITPRSGRYSFQLEAGKYTVIISKQGYVPFTAFPPIEQHETSEELTMDVRLVKSGSGSLSGTIRRTSDNTQLQGVTVNLCSGWYAQNASVLQSTTTNAEGRYSFASLSNGYYTIAMLKDGYESKIFNITVCGDVKGQNGYLVWGDEPVVAINEEYFPDDIFRRYVRGEVYGDATDGIYASEGGLDSNGDGILSKIEVENTTWLRIDAIDIKSLKGIEYFTALQELNCSDNKLTALDVSKNTALRVLNCSNNQLTTLDVSHNIALTRLECADNQLTTLNVSGCSTLDYLFCFNNQLTYLDISSNTALTGLNCGVNKLMTLDVSHNTALMDLWCQGNKLTTIDVKHNTVLTQLGCSDNQLTVLDVSRNIALTLLECAYNKLTTLNVSACSALTYLECHDNQLTTLDLSNCPNLSSYNNSVICDSEVMVIWHSSMTSSAYTLNTSPSASLKFDSASMILAVLPSFTLDKSGTYAFTVYLDRKPPEGSSLLLLSDSEDIHGTFTKTESPLSVNVSADFTAGRTYTPVIVATSECESQSGGCNAGIAGIILLAGIIIVLSKIGHVREMRGRE